ncbi:MAG: DegQ family serine endoprotease [Acidobacteria bacterium Pan2503]|uniref:DegQ family serine endoprotease n=1 Tax=Candidatus Acidiferrum panamense TaxID=2741543 RepID=A0A7V8NWG4_9BACT|nr:DegQ family serine endoprotease [Candidatus Acidoferrum panamensis]
MNRTKSWIPSRSALVGLAFFVGTVGLGVAHEKMSVHNPPASLKLADANEGPSRNSYAPVLKSVLPAVVNISSSKVVRAPSESPEGMMPFFRQFFGGEDGDGSSVLPQPRDHREKSLGSGVVVSPEGYILTNNHVVDGATDVRVTLSDKREFQGRVVGTDPKTDIAVLQVAASNLSPITIGDSSKAEVGDTVLAIGDPFGVGETVTKGIVSATGRGNLGIEDYEDFIQTDAPINPGNSGGALINDRGELVGINTAILTHGSGGNQGIGFAVPSNLARTVLEEILKSGKVTRGYLGIYPQDVTPAIAKAFGEKDPGGVLVGDVSPNSPAEAAGLRRGDIILEVNGKPMTGSNQLRMTISMMQPGSAAKLKVVHDGSQRELTIKLHELPTEQAEMNNETGDQPQASAGIEVANLTPEIAQHLHLAPTTTGVVVKHVDPSSPLAESGLREGDVIQEVNHQPVKNVSDFHNAMHKDATNPLLLVNRGGRTLFVTA